MPCNWFSTKIYCFHEGLLTQFWLFALNISVCTNTEHQGNRYPAARYSASPQKPLRSSSIRQGTVTILRGVHGLVLIKRWQSLLMHICVSQWWWVTTNMALLSCHESNYVMSFLKCVPTLLAKLKSYDLLWFDPWTSLRPPYLLDNREANALIYWGFFPVALPW